MCSTVILHPRCHLQPQLLPVQLQVLVLAADRLGGGVPTVTPPSVLQLLLAEGTASHS